MQGWIEVMGLAQPRFLVTAENVQRGKPDPGCYLLGAERLGLGMGTAAGSQKNLNGGRGQVNGSGMGSVKRILVLEDAPAGVRAGKAAGFEVVGLATSHRVEQLQEAGADWIVKDLASVRMVNWDGEKRAVEIEIRDALKA